MNNSSKEQIGCDVICRNHSARTERDLYRICPSKLSKRELEDLYFSLLENNVDLKKSVNVLQDKIKVISTRLQRMTVSQRNVAGKEKDCCASKAIMNQQRESIIDLKKTNERMAERIRLLNMRLCSAKQFLKRSPSQANTTTKTCTRCSFKNSSMTALPAKPNDSTGTAAVSYQFIDKELSARAIKTAEADTVKQEKEDSEKICNENKCRTTINELIEKIDNLQEELATCHTEYSERIARLESQVLELQDENLRVRSDHVTSEHALQQRRKKADLLQDQLRTADAKCNELNMELTIEKKKVVELETSLKLADISNDAMQTIKELAAAKDNLKVPPSSPKSKDEVKLSMSDDSGYTDLNKSCETDDDRAMVKINQDLLKKIAELKTELYVLRIASAGRTASTPKTKDFESYDVETKHVDETRSEIAEDSESGVVEVKKSLIQNTNAKIQENNETEDSKPPANSEPGPSKPREDYMDRAHTPNVDKEIRIDMDERSVSSTTIVVKSDFEGTRDDDHNRYQIPDPIAQESTSVDVSPKIKRKPSENDQSSIERLKTKKSSSEEKTVKIFESSKDSVLNSEKQINIEPMKLRHSIKNLKEHSKDVEDHKNNDIERRVKSVSITDVTKLDRSRDTILVNRKKLARLEEADRLELIELDRVDDTISEVNKESTLSILDSSSLSTPVNTSQEKRNALQQGTQSDDNIDNYGAQVGSGPARRDSATYTADLPNTYTVDKRERATSPENTEHEISSLTDLPSENVKSARCLSPGEEKGTMTFTDTEQAYSDYKSLSEGEMPTIGSGRRLSAGERVPITTCTPMLPGTSSEKMEATLQSISEELARCRQLLMSRPQEVIIWSSVN